MTPETTPSALEHSISKLIETGRFQTRDDVLREGVRLIEAEEAQWAELDARILKGIAEADADDTLPAEVVFDRLIAKYQAMSPPL